MFPRGCHDLLAPPGGPDGSCPAPLTVVSVRVGPLVVLLVEAVQVTELRQHLEDVVPVVVGCGHLAAVQVQALQVLQVLLHRQRAMTRRKKRNCVQATTSVANSLYFSPVCI